MNIQGIYLYTVFSGYLDPSLNRYYWVEKRIEVAQGQHTAYMPVRDE